MHSIECPRCRVVTDETTEAWDRATRTGACPRCGQVLEQFGAREQLSGVPKLHSSCAFTGDEVLSAVGQNVDYYVTHWALDRETPRTISWNWAAFLFNVYWLAYRRMYREFFTFAGVMLLLAALMLAASLVSGSDPEARFPAPWDTIAIVIGLLFIVAIGAGFGSLANLLYLKKVRRTIETAKRQHSSSQARLDSIRKKGGTSPLAVGVLVVINAADRILDLVTR